MPAGGADVAVDIDADAQDVVAADLLSGNEEERVFHQRGSEGCGLVGHAGPQPLSAIVALGRVLGGDGSVKVADELVAVVRSEELAQDDIAEGFEEVELVCSEAGGHGLLTWSNARADGNRRRERATRRKPTLLVNITKFDPLSRPPGRRHRSHCHFDTDLGWCFLNLPTAASAMYIDHKSVVRNTLRSRLLNAYSLRREKI